MSDTTVTFTHYGWFGLCPIIIAQHDSDMPVFQARYRFTEWLFDFSDWMYERCNDILTFMNPDYEPGYPFTIRGELDPPLTVKANE